MRRFLWLLGLLLCASVALAHPTDVIVQAAYITLAPTRANLELDLTPGELVAPRFVALLDRDANGQISPAELGGFTARLLKQVSLKVGDGRLALRLEKSVVPSGAARRTGGSPLQLYFSADIPNAGETNTLEFRNLYAPIASAYLANVFVQDVGVKILGQQRDATQQYFQVRYRLAARAPQMTLWWLPVAFALAAPMAWWGYKRSASVAVVRRT